MQEQEYLQKLGRDDSYIEVDADDLTQVDLTPAKMVVLKCIRLELTDEKHVTALKTAIKKLQDSGELNGMTTDQAGFFVLRKIFETGLIYGGGQVG